MCFQASSNTAQRSLRPINSVGTPPSRFARNWSWMPGWARWVGPDTGRMPSWKLGPMVIGSNGLFHLLLNGVNWGYNLLTSHLLTSWDIQVAFRQMDGYCEDAIRKQGTKRIRSSALFFGFNGTKKTWARWLIAPPFFLLERWDWCRGCIWPNCKGTRVYRHLW